MRRCGSKNAGTLLLLALCLVLFPFTLVWGHGDLHQQIEAVSRHLERTPAAELYLKRAELHRAHQDYPAALADYDRAEVLDPKLEAVLLARGRALLETNRYKEAENALSRFLERKPDHTAAYFYRARAAAGLKQFERAAADYGRAIELSETPKPDYYLERVDVFKAAGKPAEALNSLEQGIARLGSLVTLEMAALEIETDLKRYGAALARVDRLLARAQRKETWLERRAAILVEAGRRKDAQQTYEDALASVLALPPRLRKIRATQEAEKRIRAALAAFPQERS